MTKPTLKSLQDRIDTLQVLHEGDCATIEHLRSENTYLKTTNEELRKDKNWHAQMLSVMLQATGELFRKKKCHPSAITNPTPPPNFS